MFHVYVRRADRRDSSQEKAGGVEWWVFVGCANFASTLGHKNPKTDFIDAKKLALGVAELAKAQLIQAGHEVCLCDNANGTAPCGTMPMSGPGMGSRP